MNVEYQHEYQLISTHNKNFMGNELLYIFSLFKVVFVLWDLYQQVQKKKSVSNVVKDEKFLTFFLQQNFEFHNFPWLGFIILKNFLNFVNLFTFWTKILV